MTKAIAALLALSLIAAGPRPMDSAMRQQIDAIAQNALTQQNVPGVSVTVSEGGQIVYARGFGLGSVDNTIGAGASTTFRIGSITKQFTAASIMLLQQQGKLNVDDKLSKYLPWAPHASEVTLRQLLTHTSGIPGYTELESFDAASKLPVTPVGIVQTIASKPLAFAPGTNWEYSNTNFVLLGLVIQKITGESYTDFVMRHLVQPLHLSSMSYWDPLVVHRDAAIGYSTLPLEPVLHTIDWNWDWAWAAGGLNTTASDLARWDAALDSGKVVSPASFRMMTTEQKLRNGKPTGYGFGLGIGMYHKRKVVAHTGGVPGFITENYTIPRDGVAIVVFGNSDSFQPRAVVRNIADVLYGYPHVEAKIKPMNESATQAARDKRYLQNLLAGRFDSIPLREDAARYLHGVLVEQYRDLATKLGALHSLELVSADPRPPVLSYYYRAVFANGTMLYTIGMDPNGTVAGLGLQQWI